MDNSNHSYCFSVSQIVPLKTFVLCTGVTNSYYFLHLLHFGK